MTELIDIEKKIDTIAARLDGDINKKKNTMTVTVVGGVILLVIVFIYFGYIKSRIRIAIEPSGVMPWASEQVQKMLPDISKSAEEELIKSAPKIARDSRKELMKAIPDARKYLEAQIKIKTGEALDQLILEFDKIVTTALDDHKAEIVGFMRDILDPAKKDKIPDEIYTALEAQFKQPEIKADIDAYTNILIRLNRKITYLYAGKDLTDEEKTVLDIIYCVRELAGRGAKSAVVKP